MSLFISIRIASWKGKCFFQLTVHDQVTPLDWCLPQDGEDRGYALEQPPGEPGGREASPNQPSHENHILQQSPMTWRPPIKPTSQTSLYPLLINPSCKASIEVPARFCQAKSCLVHLWYRKTKNHLLATSWLFKCLLEMVDAEIRTLKPNLGLLWKTFMCLNHTCHLPSHALAASWNLKWSWDCHWALQYQMWAF